MSLFHLGKAKVILIPDLNVAIQSKLNCRTPAIGMEYTNQTIRLLSVVHAISRAATIMTFKITGVAAATAKRPVVFRIPENKAAKEINNM